MPWTLRFSSLDDRINGRSLLDRFRADEAVRGVTVAFLADHTMEVHLDFHEGFDAPTNLLLRRDASPYLVLEEVPIDIEPIPRRRATGMTENFIRIYGSDESRRTLDQPGLDNETRQRIISNFLNSVSGREHLAQSMAAPLRRTRDYQSVGRRTFLVEQMPQGAIPVYDRDPEVHTPGHDTDYLALPGTDPLHSTKHYQAGELPPWAVVGAWVHAVKFRGTVADRIGKIVNLYMTEDRQRRAHLHIILGIWRTTESLDLCAHHLVLGWEPCQQPPEPLSIWARILGDDFLDD